MKIESIRLNNFRAFKDAEMRNVPGMCVLVGANGTGKSTLFSVFGCRSLLAWPATVTRPVFVGCL